MAVVVTPKHNSKHKWTDLPYGTPHATGVTIDSNGAITGFTGLVAGTGYSRPPHSHVSIFKWCVPRTANLTAVNATVR